MAEPYIGEVKLFGGNFAIQGWAFCNGQVLGIAQFDALYTLLGTTFGGDGLATFGLPNLMSRVPVHQGNGLVIGQMGGVEEVTLTQAQLAAHTHPMQANTAAGNETQPANNVPAQAPLDIYVQAITPTATMAPNISFVGGNQSHNNVQPFQCANFIIALEGIFPSPN